MKTIKKYKVTILMLIIFLFAIGGIVYALNSEYGTKPVESTTETTTKPTTTKPETTESTTEATTETTTKQTTKQTTKPTTTKPTTTKKELGLVSSHNYNHIGNFRITGYTHEEGFTYGKQTAWKYGTCRPGICAMNKSQMNDLGIHYGDYIYVNNIGEFRVEDCGCPYGTIDIWVYTNQEAYQLTGYQDVYRRVNK